MFIAIEGGEGAGKSTFSQALCERLTLLGRVVCRTFEPGGTPLGNQIRSILMNEPCAETDVELLLFTAARVQHWRTVIRPALERGEIVVCDRFIDSTRVYQGVLNGNKYVDTLHDLFLSDVKPDIVLILDLDVESSLARVQQRGEPLTHWDARSREYHARIRQGFLDLAQKGASYRVLDAARPTIDLVDEVIEMMGLA